VTAAGMGISRRTGLFQSTPGWSMTHGTMLPRNQKKNATQHNYRLQVEKNPINQHLQPIKTHTLGMITDRFHFLSFKGFG
jgi:hypothetical protein